MNDHQRIADRVAEAERTNPIGVFAPFFTPKPLQRADLIAAGWTPPPRPEKPKVHRVRLVLWRRFDQWRIDFEGSQGSAAPILGTAMVELTEGAFDPEWTR